MTEPPPAAPPPAPASPPPPLTPPQAGLLPQVPWGAGRTFAALAALIGLVILEAGIVAAFDPEIESLGARLGLQLALVITFVGVALAAARPGPGWADPAALGIRRPLRPAVKPAVIAYLAYIGAAIAIAALIQPEQEDITRELGVDEGVLGAVGAGLLIVVGASVSEELFFRGFMFAGLRNGSPFWLAALVSSAIWGLFHYTDPDSWGVCLQLTVFGLALCWLYERTGSIWPTIAVHAFNNALAFSILAS